MASHTHDGEFGFQIAPMLDILFVLLLFFIVCAGVQKREATLTTKLPGIAPPGPQVEVNLEITSEGQVMLNGASVDSTTDHSLPETVARLRAVVADAPERPIVIRPDPGTRHQRVVDVLNACKGAGARNVAFGAIAD